MDTIGRYEILNQLGQGGMATVYLAHDPTFQRKVAIKVLAANIQADPDLRARFEREARIIAAIEHPAIVLVYDYGEHNGAPYLVMRYMPGGTLAERVRHGPLPIGALLDTLLRLAEALDLAHQRGIIHRDLKPGNILFDEFRNPYLSDFGIAKLVGAESRTATGVLGTPAYMSPEQARGKPDDIDYRTDLYSFAVIAFQLLTGEMPFEADTPVGLALAHLTQPPPTPSSRNQTLHADVDEVLHIALSKAPADRYPSAMAFVKALRRATVGRLAAPPSDIATMLEGPAMQAPLERQIATPLPPTPTPSATPPTHRGLPRWAILALVALAVIAALALLVGGGALTAAVLLRPSPVPPTEAALILAEDPTPADSSPTAPTPPPPTTALETTAPPTSAPTPTTTVLPVLASAPAESQVSGLTSIWSLTTFDELTTPGERTYAIRVEPNRAYRWTFIWCARGTDRLQAILDPLQLEFRINGRALAPSQYLIYYGEEAGWQCYYQVARLNNWQPGATLTLETAYTLQSDIFDGENTYPAGDYRQILTVTVNP